jgi:hypothetical protein
LAISQQISEALSDMRDLKLGFLQLTRQARAQAQLIAVLIVKLRFTNQSRDGSNGATNAARLRQRTPFGAPVGIHSWWSER